MNDIEMIEIVMNLINGNLSDFREAIKKLNPQQFAELLHYSRENFGEHEMYRIIHHVKGM